MMSLDVIPVAHALAHGAPETVDNDRERDAAHGVGLRVEEDLRMDEDPAEGPHEIRVSEIGEVLLGPQRRHRRVVKSKNDCRSVNSYASRNDCTRDS